MRAHFALAALATLSITSFPRVSTAAAAAVGAQAPGYYRMMLGDIEITTLSDGTMDLPVEKLLTNIQAARLDELLSRSFLESPVETSVNAFLINTGSKLVLVDSGAGALFGPTVGKLQASLQAAGYRADQIDAVLITHLHGDHMGGLSVNGVAAFPNAVVYLSKSEADYWLSTDNAAKATGDLKSAFQMAAAIFKPYVAAGKIKHTTDGMEIVPGIRAVATSGHTPGHNAYSVESKGEKLMLWGDLMHVAAVQFPEPSVTINFDTDSNAAKAQRAKAFSAAAADGSWVCAAHLPFPGLGHIRASGNGYEWIPVNYSANRKAN